MKNFLKGSRNSTLGLNALLLSAIVIPAPAFANEGQPAEPASAGEIIVTAQKRSERIIDVPMAITTASGDQLAKQGITDTSQLTKLVPSFTYQQSNYGTPVFTIRGVGYLDYSVTAGPTVTAYVDQVPLPYSVMTRGATLDLERVEVLKGPQGTLFGQNSTGGAINYIAAKPTRSFAAGVDVSYGRFNELNVGGFVSGPITDTLRARVAVRSENMDGWQKSLTRPGDTMGDKQFNNARLLVDWEPTDALSFELNVSAFQDRSEMTADQLIAVIPQNVLNVRSAPRIAELAASPIPTSVRQADWDAGDDYSRDDNFFLTSLRGDWRINDAVTLTSITAFSRETTNHPVDLDGSAVENFKYLKQDGLLKSFSEELRLSGDVGPVKWMVGGNYQEQKAEEYQLLDNAGSQGSLDLSFAAPFLGPDVGKLYYWNMSAYYNNQRPISKSVFGSIDYDLTDELTLRASARYTEEDRKFNGCLADAGADPNAIYDALRDGFAALSTVLSGSLTTIPKGGCLTFNDATSKPELARRELSENNVSWRVGADWKPNSDMLLYGTIAKGFKAGGFSILPSIFASQLDPVTQESLLAYEAGVKVQLMDRKLQLNGALFYYDYTDKQLLGYADTPFGRLPKLINVPKSKVEGFEVEGTLLPIEGMRITGGVSYVMSEVKEDPPLAIDPLGHPTSFIGQAFPNTPKWQAVADVEYNRPVTDNWNAFVGGSVTYRGKSNANFGDLPQFELNSYTLVDLRGGVESADGKWRAQLYGRNITNEWYWVNVFITTDALVKAPAMPSTYGLTLSYRY